MLTANLWQEVGLSNGAAGTVYDIIYQEGHQPPSLPVAALVQFDDYCGPQFHNNCVPIAPITFEWMPTPIPSVITSSTPLCSNDSQQSGANIS